MCIYIYIYIYVYVIVRDIYIYIHIYIYIYIYIYVLPLLFSQDRQTASTATAATLRPSGGDFDIHQTLAIRISNYIPFYYIVLSFILPYSITLHLPRHPE